MRYFVLFCSWLPDCVGKYFVLTLLTSAKQDVIFVAGGALSCRKFKVFKVKDFLQNSQNKTIHCCGTTNSRDKERYGIGENSQLLIRLSDSKSFDSFDENIKLDKIVNIFQLSKEIPNVHKPEVAKITQASVWDSLQIFAP